MMNRIEAIKTRLETAFHPEQLEVIDDSAKHLGHAGALSGAGHFTVKISAKHFANKSRVEAHREIYAALDHLIGPEIHALVIKIY